MTKTKIYISGAQSTGKSTLCRELGRHLGYEVVTEAARDIMNADKIDFSKIALDVTARDSFQNKVADEHIGRHIKAWNNLTTADNEVVGYVFDRGLDFLVYAAGFSTVAHKQYNWQKTRQYLMDLKNDNALVVLLEPHEHLLKEDGVRAGLNMKGSYEVTFAIKVLLEVHGIPYIYVTTPDTMERVKLITNIIGA